MVGVALPAQLEWWGTGRLWTADPGINRTLFRHRGMLVRSAGRQRRCFHTGRRRAHLPWSHSRHPRPLARRAVFTSSGFEGEPRETDEMRPEWFDASMDAIPFDQMWCAKRAAGPA